MLHAVALRVLLVSVVCGMLLKHFEKWDGSLGSRISASWCYIMQPLALRLSGHCLFR